MNEQIYYTLFALNFMTALSVLLIQIFNKHYRNRYHIPLLLFTITQIILFGYRFTCYYLDVPLLEQTYIEANIIFMTFSCAYLYYIAYLAFYGDKLSVTLTSGILTYITGLVVYFISDRFGIELESFSIGMNAFSNESTITFNMELIFVLFSRILHPLIMLILMYRLKKSRHLRAFSIMAFVFIISIVTRNLYGQTHKNIVCITYFLNLIFFLYLAYMHLINPESVRKSMSSKAKTEQELHHKQKLSTLWTELQVYMIREKPWLNPRLSSEKIAEKLKTDKTTILLIISEYGKSNIYNFIASYRIEEFCKEIKQNKEHDVMELFHKVGFKSSSSAYMQFKRIKGISPKAYIEQTKTAAK